MPLYRVAVLEQRTVYYEVFADSEDQALHLVVESGEGDFVGENDASTERTDARIVR